MATMYRGLLERLESCRRWGLVCGCPHHIAQREELRQQGKNTKIDCVHNSRRLPEARDFFFKVVNEIQTAGRRIDLADAEGNSRVLLEVSKSQRKTATWLSNKGTWLKRSPWIMCEARDPAIAKELRMQLHNAVPAKLTALEEEYIECYDEDLKVAPNRQTYF